MIQNFLIVGLGGAAGSMLRYAVQKVFQSPNAGAFPTGTLLLNIAGCFLIGILWGMISRSLVWNEQMKLLLMTGFCGGFTTFSAFGNETINMWRDGELALAFANIATHVVLCLGAVWLSRAIAFQIWN